MIIYLNYNINNYYYHHVAEGTYIAMNYEQQNQAIIQTFIFRYINQYSI